MRVFLSWSGPISQQIAREVHDWLPLVLQHVEVFLSPVEIEKGSRWGGDLQRELEGCNFGIVCLTRENLKAPWIAFEAGALSKAISGRVAVVLFGLRPADVQPPLSLFQATVFEKEDLRLLAQTINNNSPTEEKCTEAILAKSFDAFWKEFEEKVALLIQTPAPAATAELTTEQRIATLTPIVEELLIIARQQNQRLGDEVVRAIRSALETGQPISPNLLHRIHQRVTHILFELNKIDGSAFENWYSIISALEALREYIEENDRRRLDNTRRARRFIRVEGGKPEPVPDDGTEAAASSTP